jgi:hypothetical protein
VRQHLQRAPQGLLARALPKVLESLDSGEPIVEITDQW